MNASSISRPIAMRLGLGSGGRYLGHAFVQAQIAAQVAPLSLLLAALLDDLVPCHRPSKASSFSGLSRSYWPEAARTKKLLRTDWHMSAGSRSRRSLGSFILSPNLQPQSRLILTDKLGRCLLVPQLRTLDRNSANDCVILPAGLAGHCRWWSSSRSSHGQSVGAGARTTVWFPRAGTRRTPCGEAAPARISILNGCLTIIRSHTLQVESLGAENTPSTGWGESRSCNAQHGGLATGTIVIRRLRGHFCFRPRPGLGAKRCSTHSASDRGFRNSCPVRKAKAIKSSRP